MYNINVYFQGVENMISILPEFFNDFHCKADQCSHTCCQVWEIDIDEDTADYYGSLPGPLGEKIRRSMAKDGDTWHFTLNERGYCHLLDDKGLCTIIKELGEDALCDICTVHPRFFTYVDDYILCGVGLCCEETCELISQLAGPLHFMDEDTGTPLLFATLLEGMGLAMPEEELHFVPAPDAGCYHKLLARLAGTEPIDQAWTDRLQELLARVPEIVKAAEAYKSSCDATLFDRLYQYIFYRQLDKADTYGMRTLAEYARESTEYVYLESALTHNPREAMHRWSEQIEYDTENVDFLCNDVRHKA